MQDFEKLYHILFSAATSAVESIGECDYGQARRTLISAQQTAEEAYMADCEDPGGET